MGRFVNFASKYGCPERPRHAGCEVVAQEEQMTGFTTCALQPVYILSIFRRKETLNLKRNRKQYHTEQEVNT